MTLRLSNERSIPSLTRERGRPFTPHLSQAVFAPKLDGTHDAMIEGMRLLLPLACVFTLVACGSSNGEVCPPDWANSTTAPGGCEAPTSLTSTLSGVYGFVRTNAHGSNQLVVGTDVFAIPAAAGSCQAASATAIQQTTTDQDGVFNFVLGPGGYLITSGEVPSCIAVTVDANSPSEVALTSP